MLSTQQFKTIVEQVTRVISLEAKGKDDHQPRAILAKKTQSLFLVAGPGSGKTTALTLRILKLIFVDKVPPEAIMATTFTRKAAAELTSRILEYGLGIREVILADNLFGSHHDQLRRLDLNSLRVGTLDSLAEDLLTEFRSTSENAPVVIETFARNALLLRKGVFGRGLHKSNSFKHYVKDVRGETPRIVRSYIDFLSTLRDRIVNDRVNVGQYLRSIGKRNVDNSIKQGADRAFTALSTYADDLKERQVLDFPALEVSFLDALETDRLEDFLGGLKFVLVDEYQDTNALQEAIYFKLASVAVENGGSTCVVGDDDQSLFRFRGATVELFRDFEPRLNAHTNKMVSPKKLHLNRNYRSTSSIVSFVNGFVQLDPDYGAARVTGKPDLVAERNNIVTEYPIFGLFRDDLDKLAESMAQLIDALVNGGGVNISDGDKSWKLALDKNNGSPNDIAVLGSSVREYSSGGKERLPWYLRHKLARLKSPIKVFNPRGQELTKVGDVRKLLGLVLECIDPNGNIQNDLKLGRLADEMGAWRTEGIEFINDKSNDDLRAFVDAWQRRKPTRQVRREERVSINDIIYKLLPWLPEFRYDVESLTYLEAISRTIADAALFSSFNSEIVFVRDDVGEQWSYHSVKSAIQDIFSVIASGAIDVNEDLLETLPSDRVNIMTVHQAKGLEFPITIVDVGSDFSNNHWKQESRRFPLERSIGPSYRLEDEFREFTNIDQGTRSARDRAFDDLVRLYFVGFSRPQDVLILAGHSKVISGNGIKNVPTGWCRDGSWSWGSGLTNLVHIDS